MQEDERPDWQDPPPEEIPPALSEKWQKDEIRGKGAGVCPSCQWPFLDEDLSCRHCGRPVEVPSGVISSMFLWLMKTPWGIVTFVIILLAVIAFLI